MKALDPDFFNHPTLWVARHLIGAYLCRRTQQTVQTDMIVEAEAYLGPQDLASHARFGKTHRNAPMYETGGIWYVYVCYGIHSMLNIVTGPKDHPGAVLIRALQHHSGPGRLTCAFGITPAFNRQPCTPESNLWLIPAPKPIPVQTKARIGIAYAGPIWSQKPYRFTALI